jgi:ergothioneine biosynthesis protein EgtB
MLKEKYKQVRNRTEEICSTLSPEDSVVQAAEFASPPKWHLGHTTWFFETFILKKHDPQYKVFNPDFDFIFNSYYESIGERVKRSSRGILFRPYLHEIMAYRKHVDAAIDQYFSGFNAELLSILELGLNHEQQHQELLMTDTKYMFSQNPTWPVWDEKKTLDLYHEVGPAKWLTVEEGVYSIGQEGNGFCFDNELPAHQQYIHAFEIMNRPVTNGEFIEFIEAGGYHHFAYWLAEGWDWINREKVEKPLYWHQNTEGDYMFYHLDGLKKLDPDLPLMHISYYEADAFAHWKGASLPTEYEWETAAKKHSSFFKNRVWEWTSSAYLPYPGYTIAPGAIGEYNGKFMINQMVLRGGSIATPEGHSRVTYRNFFHPQSQWQFSGLRLIKRKKQIEI